MKENELTIIPSELAKSQDIERNISTISKPLSNFLEHVGLPSNDLVAPVDERRKVIQSIESALEVLGMEEREKAVYISKFAICVAVGLFDGALAFLWDETIKALRAKVVDFDLEYFYSIAYSLSTRYKGLTDPDELPAISEHDLLEICRRMGLIDDVNHRRLDNVNYFRNHASSAHPNEVELSGIELLSFLESCLKYAICAPLEHSVIQVKRFLQNVRQHTIDETDYPAIVGEIERLPLQRIEDILRTLFGMYCDPQIGQSTLDNITGLAPDIWDCVSDDFRFKIGGKFGYYRANGDVPRKERTQEFLDSVDGNRYKDEDSLGVELVEKLQDLRSAHFGMNNFYNEYPYAQSIQQSLPTTAGVPASARHDFVKVISICYIGNGLGYREGVDERALPYYEKFLKRLSDEDYIIFLNLFADHEFTGDMGRETVRERTEELCKKFRAETKNVHIRRALRIVYECPRLQDVHKTKDFRNAMAKLN